jgi:hypothetical protein
MSWERQNTMQKAIIVIIQVKSFFLKAGKRIRRMTTKGWQLCVQWKYGFTIWECLKDLNQSNPVQIAEYAVENSIDSEPAFAWWATFTIKKRTMKIAKIKTRYLLASLKFGIELPKSVKAALAIDEATNTTYCKDEIVLEIKNVDVAFQDFEDGGCVPVG